ncbi:MAG: enoyl-CoA hydratase [Proteobacteria bacterium]|nr:enoyl-CoA hydratase [Pseudomonadota bacterium]
MTTYESITCQIERGVAMVTMNRTQRRNALSLDMMGEMIACLDHLATATEVRVVVLRAAGKVFCSGHDLSEVLEADIAGLRALFETCSRMMARIASHPRPVIAEVGGVATAAGCQLVAACDLAVASTEATFSTPGVRIGLFCTTPSVALSRAIGRKRAMQMLLTGESIDAQRASDWGLVNMVVEPEVLRTETKQLARRIAEASPLTIAIGKRAFHAQIDVSEAAAYALASEVMTVNALADDAREGMRAFLEKRKPSWSGR